MPSRKRGQEGKQTRSWSMMLREDVRAAEVARIREQHPSVAKALDLMATRYKVYEEHGFTAFTDWLLEFSSRARSAWPNDIPSVESMMDVVFPSASTTQKQKTT